MEEFGEAFYEFGFSEAGETFEEDVAAGEYAGGDQFDDGFLAEEDLVEGLGEGAEVFGGFFYFGFRGVIHVGKS